MRTKDINVLHSELSHPLEVTTKATDRAISLYLTGTFKHQDCAMGKFKECRVGEKAVECSKVLGFNISSSLTTIFGGKKHWLLVIEDSSDYAWGYFLKDKSTLKNVMLGIVNDLKTMIIR